MLKCCGFLYNMEKSNVVAWKDIFHDNLINYRTHFLSIKPLKFILFN